MVLVELVEPTLWNNVKAQIDDDFGEGVTEKIRGNLAPIILERGTIKTLYLIPMEWLSILEKDIEGFLVSSAGFWLGDLADGRFRLSIAILERIAKVTDKKLVVSGTGAEAFTYGKSILRESVVWVTPTLRKGQRVIVTNDNDECLGLARLSVDASRLERLAPDKLVAKNLIDIGWYLRRLG